MFTVTRRIVAAAAGPALAAGLLAAGIAAGSPAQAAEPQGSTCVTAMAKTAPPTMLNPLTRAGQVAGISAATQESAPATSCLTR